MPVFRYTKLSGAGHKEQSTVEAPSVADARRRLRAAGVHVIEITDGQIDVQHQLAGQPRTIGFRKIKRRDLSTAIWQLASLLHAGIALVPALSAMVEQLGNRPLAGVFGQIRDKVNEGTSLAKAMEEYPAVFSEIFISMVSAGEATGTLENVLSRLAEMSEKRNNLTNKVKAAMAYPLFMAVAGVAVVGFIFAFVIPSIAKLFLEMNRQLPWPTIMLIGISDFTQRYFWVLLAVPGVFAGALVLWLRTTAGRETWDRLKLKCPLLGGLALKMAVSRFSRTLAVLLASGLPIVEALDLARRVIGNSAVSAVVEDAKDAISHGERIANSFRKSGVFPPIVIHMIAAGEKSGSIEEGLANVADVFDNEVETTVKALTSLLEPLMIVLLGTIVGFIVLAILLPIFDINQAIV